jgi:hypothetical protein
MQGLPATVTPPTNGVPRNREVSTRDCLAQSFGCDACELPAGLKKRVVAQLKPHAAPGLIMMVINSRFSCTRAAWKVRPVRRYSVVNARNSSRATSPKSLRCEPINSEWSGDVRFAAHSGLKSDITALPKSGRSVRGEGKDSPNTKYRSRSALLQERASKLVSGGGELTTRVEPAVIGCEA